MDFKSSRPAFTATEVRVEGAGAKAAADPINASRDNFIMVDSVSVGGELNSCFPLNQVRSDFNLPLNQALTGP